MLRNPITGIACCARAASGQAAAALPRSVMKLRLLMQIARQGQSLAKGSVVRHSKIDRRWQRRGQTRPRSHVRVAARFTPTTAVVLQRRERQFRADCVAKVAVKKLWNWILKQ